MHDFGKEIEIAPKSGLLQLVDWTLYNKALHLILSLLFQLREFATTFPGFNLKKFEQKKS